MIHSFNMSLKFTPIDRQFWGQGQSEHPFTRKLKFISQFLHNRSENINLMERWDCCEADCWFLPFVNQFSQFHLIFTISTKFSQFQPNFHNFNQFSQFQPIFTISTNFHNFTYFSQFQPNFHNFNQIFTISTNFHNFKIFKWS